MKKIIIAITVFSVAGFANAQGFAPRNEVMREVKKPVMPIMKGATASSTDKRMMGSSTPLQKKVLKATEKKEVALMQKDKLVERLNQAITNLTNATNFLGESIDKRIVEEKPVGKAKELLTTANTKIEVAKKAVTAVVAWKPDPKVASSTAISLTKPRETANAAIKAVQEARKSVGEVVKELKAQVKTNQ